MLIEFYRNLSDPDTLNKNITKVFELIGTLRDECDVENPVIMIEHCGMLFANYCYIPDFGRYYYIENQTIVRNDLVRLTLKVDVLYTYKEQIKALNVIINNSSDNNDNYLSSELWVAKVKTSTDIINFPSGFNDNGEFVLITAGG